MLFRSGNARLWPATAPSRQTLRAGAGRAWRGAQLWYLAAAKLGPRLPAAFADWGRLLAKAGRYQSAEVKLKEAVRLAPNWADPLKTWGDMLASQGKRADALAKYDAALKLAPNWRELQSARAKVVAART